MKCKICKKRIGLLDKRILYYGKILCKKCGEKLNNAGKPKQWKQE